MPSNKKLGKKTKANSLKKIKKQTRNVKKAKAVSKKKKAPPKKAALLKKKKAVSPSKSNKDNTLKIKTKTLPLPAGTTTIKNNLAELMPDYQRTEENIGKDYMNPVKKKYFHDLLNRWKTELMQKVDQTVGLMKDEIINFPDPADRASQEEGLTLELKARDRERKLIKKIDEALINIENDDYGYCEACGIEIGYKRLEARPTATLCIDCKTVDEIRERQLSS